MPKFETQIKVTKEYYFEYVVEADSKEQAKQIVCDLYDRGSLYNERSMEPDDMLLPPNVVPSDTQPYSPYEDGYFDFEYVTQINEEDDN